MNRKLSPHEYILVRDFFSREFGLFFDPSKVTFLENRLMPVFEEAGCTDMVAFLARIHSDPDRRKRILDAVTTNETWFFRHPRHFDILREQVLNQLLRERAKAGNRRIGIWSAGCSIGAETFSLAITLRETIKNPADWSVTLIGSDISTAALARAREGIYSAEELKLLSNMLLSKYFIPVSHGCFQVKPDLMAMVEFENRNLLSDWPERSFDVIFCRNTMIYFHESTKAALTERFFKALSPNGVFFTSATETIHWGEQGGFAKEFIHGEYIYRKTAQAKNFVLYKFRTPSDLLKALNLLVKSQHEYHLLPIPQATPASPKKAIFIPKGLSGIVERLFSEASLSSASREEITR